MRWLQQALDLLVYGNWWIGLAALCLYAQTQCILLGRYHWDRVGWFVLGATVFLYGLHRTEGLKNLPPDLRNARWSAIAHHKNYIQAISSVTGVLILTLFVGLPWTLKCAIAFPAVLGFAYALPIFPGRRRLRDYPGVKIFVLAITWSWVTVALPALSSHTFDRWAVGPMLLERACYIFSLALAFDIRDWGMDQHLPALTLPRFWGIHRAKVIGYCGLALAIGFAGVNYWLDAYSGAVLLAVVWSMFLGGLSLYWAHPQRPDAYFSVGVDGLLILQGLLVGWAATLAS